MRKTFLDVAIAAKRARNIRCDYFRFGGVLRGIRICRTCGHNVTNHS